MELGIGLPLRNQSALQSLLKDVYNPKSPRFHKFLTPAQFTAMFGPTQKDYQAVIDFAKASGLNVVRTYPKRLVVKVTGTASDVQRVFHVNLNQYSRSDKTLFHAPDREPSIDLDIPVEHVTGLDNFRIPRNNSYRNSPKDTRFQAPAPNVPQENAAAKANSGTGSGGTYQGTDFRNAYAPNVGSLNGSGQSIGIFAVGGFYLQDIHYYESTASPAISAPDPIAVPVDGWSLAADTAGCPDCDNYEVSMDIEMAIAMAPGAQVVVYEGPTGANYQVVANDVLEAMANPPLCSQLSCSWFEFGDQTTANILAQIALQGQSFLLASGDKGAYGAGNDFFNPETPPNYTCNPNTAVPPPGYISPYMTQVGGTELTVTNGPTAYATEVVWNNANGSSGGGICTNLLPIPTWQVPVDSQNGASNQWLNIPDVALTADNVFVVAEGYGVSPSNNQYSVAGSFSGTSAAAPLWAGFISMVNEQASNEGLPSVGFLNPALYKIGVNNPGDFHDITSGKNDMSNWYAPGYQSSLCGAYGTFFTAGTGHDLTTGWGSPNGQNLINDLVAAIATPTPGPPPVSSSWSQAPGTAAFSARENFVTLFFNNKMWVLGGFSWTIPQNGDWSSSDGVNWNLANANPAYETSPSPSGGARTGAMGLVYNNKMWIIGGYAQDGLNHTFIYTDVWTTPDVVNRSLVIQGTP